MQVNEFIRKIEDISPDKAEIKESIRKIFKSFFTTNYRKDYIWWAGIFPLKEVLAQGFSLSEIYSFRLNKL